MAVLKYLSLKKQIKIKELQVFKLVSNTHTYLGEELSEMKLKTISEKVLEPPARLLEGRAIASQTYLLISSRNIPLSRVPMRSINVPAKNRKMKGFLPYLSLQLPM